MSSTVDQSQIISRLQAIVGEEKVKTDADSLDTFGKDWTKIYAPKPLAITFPKTTEQVAEIVKAANELDFAIVPSGGRTGLSAGAVAANGDRLVAADLLGAVDADRDRLVLADGLGPVVADLFFLIVLDDVVLIVADLLVLVVADRLAVVVLDLDDPVLLTVDVDVLLALGVLEAQLVEAPTSG